MVVTRLEDLPNELWLEVLVYFTWSELNSTWVQWKLNNRIEMLVKVAENRVALSLSSMSLKTWSECLHYLENEHPMMASRITSLLLNESVLSSEIVNHWLENGACFLPRIRQCTVYMDLINRSVRRNILLLIGRHASMLRRIVFYFDRVDRYYSIMEMFIEQGISLHTMQFIITKDNSSFPWRSSLSECAIHSHQVFTFANTVRLRLSFQHLSDLALLMQCHTLPRIEHLHLTMENGLHQSPNGYENASSLRFSSNHFHQSQSSRMNLRTLFLRQIDMSDVIQLIENVESISQLQSFVLVNCHVQNKNELIRFRSSIRNVFISLRSLHFVFYLPVQTKLENIDLDWFCLNHHAVQYEINELMMILYTVPYPLNSQRQISNDTFGRQLTINKNINHIQWTIDRDCLSIDRTLIHFQHVSSLVLFIDIQKVSINVNSWDVLLPFLRHLQIHFHSNPMKCRQSSDRSGTPKDYRCFILQQFRQCTSILQCLTLSWSDVRLLLKHSSSPWPCIRQLNTFLETSTNIPSPSTIKQLPTNKAFPQLQYLSFGGRRFSLTQPKSLAIQILLCFDALVSSSSKFLILHINRSCGTHLTLPFTSRDKLLTILTEGIRSRSDQYSLSKIIIDPNEEIIIWI